MDVKWILLDLDGFEMDFKWIVLDLGGLAWILSDVD